MNLAARIEQDYIAAYKAKDPVRLGVLRLLKTALTNFEKEHLRKPGDGDIMDVIVRQCKQRQDSIEQYKSVARPELADKEAAEMAVLQEYLPAPLTGEDLTAAIREAASSVGASSLRDMGKVMQKLMADHKGRVDGKAASEAVKAVLQTL